MDVGSEAVHNEQVSTISANGAEKSETCIDTLEPASAGALLLGKRLYTEDDVENDSSLIALSNEDLSGMAQTETTKASSETVDRGNH